MYWKKEMGESASPAEDLPVKGLLAEHMQSDRDPQGEETSGRWHGGSGKL